MYRIAEFYKVSKERFKSDWLDNFPADTDIIDEIYDSIPLPRRATAGSAGYDFYVPRDIIVRQGETVKLPTGIRVKIDDGWFLGLFPRSSLGFKYRMRLENTVGIIDADYFGAENEGHIIVKFTNCGETGDIVLHRGQGFSQGIFMPYGITLSDEATAVRQGGFGSTNG